MLEVIRTKTQTMAVNSFSQSAWEVSQFIQNYFEAVQGGDTDEISSYYSDEMESFNFPLQADWTDEVLLAEDHLATFSCTLLSGSGPGHRMTYVLDKSEGYWQIIHGVLQSKDQKH